MRKPTTNPAFLKLARIAREIGINAETIEANRCDFFDIHRLGHQRYVRAADFESWLARHNAEDQPRLKR